MAQIAIGDYKSTIEAPDTHPYHTGGSMRQLVITVTFSLCLQGDFRRFYPREALLSGDHPPRSLDTAPASQPPLKIFQRPAPSASGACARHCWPAGHHTGAFEWAAPRAPASQHQRQERLLIPRRGHLGTTHNTTQAAAVTGPSECQCRGLGPKTKAGSDGVDRKRALKMPSRRRGQPGEPSP